MVSASCHCERVCVLVMPDGVVGLAGEFLEMLCHETWQCVLPPQMRGDNNTLLTKQS